MGINRLLAALLFLVIHAHGQVVGNGRIHGGTIFGGLAALSGGGSSSSTDFSANMIACWPLDEASGTRVDDFAAFDLTDNNTVTGTTGPVGLGNASSFSAASSEYLSHADNASLRMGDFDTTFAVWANLPSLVTFPTVLSKYSEADKGYLLYWNSSTSQFAFAIQDIADVAKTVNSTATYSAGSGWHFIVCGYNSTTDNLFISVDNSAYATTATTDIPRSGTAEFRIGGVVSAGSLTTWNGGIAGAVLWNRLLTAEEITTLYAAGGGTPACP